MEICGDFGDFAPQPTPLLSYDHTFRESNTSTNVVFDYPLEALGEPIRVYQHYTRRDTESSSSCHQVIHPTAATLAPLLLAKAV